MKLTERQKSARKGARTRAANKAAWKRFYEIEKPALEAQVQLMNERIEIGPPVYLRWAGRYGRKLKNGVMRGRLIKVLGTGMSWRVLADGYKNPTDWHPSFWEVV